MDKKDLKEAISASICAVIIGSFLIGMSLEGFKLLLPTGIISVVLGTAFLITLFIILIRKGRNDEKNN